MWTFVQLCPPPRRTLLQQELTKPKATRTRKEVRSSPFPPLLVALNTHTSLANAMTRPTTPSHTMQAMVKLGSRTIRPQRTGEVSRNPGEMLAEMMLTQADAGNNAGQNNMNSRYTHTNWFYDIYDAYYNGSVSLKLDPPSGTACQGVETQSIPYSYFRIGQMSRSGAQYSRKSYDSNQFYFRLGRSTDGSGYACQYTPRKMFTSLESSNNGYDHLQVWTVSAKQNNGKYDISGSITSAYASENNYFNVLPFSSSNTTSDPNCPSHFAAATLTKDNKVTMNGTVDGTTANINWYFTDPATGWAITGTFNGTIWDSGAKLDLTNNPANPTTTGEAKRVECPDCKSDEGNDESFFEEHEKSIIAGSVVGGVVFLAVIGVVGFLLFSWYRKRQYKPARQMEHDDAFAMEDHDREFKDGAATNLRPVPSQQSLLPGHGVDTSYDAHRSPSPDPTAPGLPGYSEHYTPLK